MALIQCPECGKEISDKAVACPHCGAWLNAKTRLFALTPKKWDKKWDQKKENPLIISWLLC